MPRDASAMLLQAIANISPPRAPQPAPSNQADVYATRGVLNDAFNAWNTIQQRNEARLGRGADRAKWEGLNATNLKLRELGNAGLLAVTQERGRGALQKTDAEARAKALLQKDEQDWMKQEKFPHEVSLQGMRNKGLRDARAAGVRPPGSPRVPTDPSEALFLRTADKLYTSADRLVGSPSFGVDRNVVAQRDEMAKSLRQQAGRVRQLHAQYQAAKDVGDMAAARAARAALDAMMGGAGGAGGAAPPPAPAAAPQQFDAETLQLIQEAREIGDTEFLKQLGVE